MASFSTSTSGQFGNTPAPPPPTPSSQTISNPSFHAADADVALSHFLNQLVLNQTAPSLFFPHPRFSKKSPPPPVSPPSPLPLISLVYPQHDLVLSAASDFGFFHLTDHGIPSDIPNSAIKEFQSLLSQPEIIDSIQSHLGFSHDDDDELVFDTSSTKLDAFGDISEFANSLESLGLKLVELILSAAFIDNPFKKGTIVPKCLMWVSSSCSPPPPYGAANASVIKEEEEEEEKEEEGGRETKKGRCFPYVVSLQYEMKTTTSWVLGESGGWAAVDPSPDSVLVTLGDIAQVWSNGRFKKVRGIPQYNPLSSKDSDNSQSISISLLVTLPMDSLVCPLLPLVSNNAVGVEDDIDDGNSKLEDGQHIRF